MRPRLNCTLIFLICFSASAQSYEQSTAAANSTCGPIPAVCTPGTVNIGILGMGPAFFSFGQISNTSQNNLVGGYQDFTCSDSTLLNQGGRYYITVITGQTYVEIIKAWIDFNNDGFFDSTETIFFDPATVYLHADSITIPVSGQTGIPLRLRVGSEGETFPPPDGCTDVQYGQYEDYTVYLYGPTNLNRFDRDAHFSVFPNPFKSEATLIVREELRGESAVLKIYNSLGILLREEKIPHLPSYTLHRGELPGGIYFFEIGDQSVIIGKGKFMIHE